VPLMAFSLLLMALALPRLIGTAWASVQAQAARMGEAFADGDVLGVLARVLGIVAVVIPLLGIFYVWWWVGLVPLSLLFGPVWKAISPVRTINVAFARLSGSDPEAGVFEYPARLGYWPAALGLFAFVWMELVYPFSTELGPVRLWCAIYVALMLVCFLSSTDQTNERADPFEVYSSLVAKLSVWGRRESRLVIRSPLANLDTTRAVPGLLAVLSVLFGSTAFDSFKDSSFWVRFTQESSVSTNVLNNLALLTFCAGVGLVFVVGCVTTGVGPGTRRRELPDKFAHSIIPIVVGYIVAHYTTYYIEYGQQTLIQASDPFGNGANLLGTADLTVNYWLSFHPTFLAVLKVLAVVVGHVLGVIAAHERAIELLPKRHQLTGQLPLLFAMIAFTVGGLYLLFAA